MCVLLHCLLPNAQHSKVHRKEAQQLFIQLVKDWTINGPIEWQME